MGIKKWGGWKRASVHLPAFTPSHPRPALQGSSQEATPECTPSPPTPVSSPFGPDDVNAMIFCFLRTLLESSMRAAHGWKVGSAILLSHEPSKTLPVPRAKRDTAVARAKHHTACRTSRLSRSGCPAGPALAFQLVEFLLSILPGPLLGWQYAGLAGWLAGWLAG